MFIYEDTAYYEGLEELKEAVLERDLKPDELIEKIFNGDLGAWRDDLFYFNGYDNIEHINPFKVKNND